MNEKKGVPKEIREVERPINTVVIAYPNGRFAVRERVGCSYKLDENGNRHRIPKEGKIIGYIENEKFVRRYDTKAIVNNSRVDIKDWGNVILCDTLNRDVYNTLLEYYNIADVRWLYTEAILRTCYPGIRDCELQAHYNESFLSEMYPGVPLSKDTVSNKTHMLGNQRNTIYSFMSGQIQDLSDTDLLVIDGCLKQDNGEEICIAEVSRKTAKTGTKHHSMMYAYSIEKQEPIAEKAFPGNMIDARAIEDFVITLNITKGLIVADSGFKPEAVIEAIRDRAGLGYLIPLERNRKIITTYHMLEMDTVIKSQDRSIPCRKCQLLDEEKNPIPIWLYSYKDPAIASEEEELYLTNHQDDFNPEKYALEKQSFGTIVFQSNYDMDLARVYDIYQDRWQIESLFKFHKTGLDEDDTRMHSDSSAVGSEFINYLSTLMGSRMLKFFREHKEFHHLSYRRALEELRRYRKVRIEDGKWEDERMTKKRTMMMESIGLKIPQKSENNDQIKINQDPWRIRTPNKKGRPKGSKDSKPRTRRTKKEMEEDNLKIERK